MSTLYDATVSGHGYEIRPSEDGSIFRWAVYAPVPDRASDGVAPIASLTAPDIDSAYAMCDGAVRRHGGLVARRSKIAASIRASNPHLSDRAVDCLVEEVVAEIRGG